MSTIPPISSSRFAPVTFCSSPAASICASQSRRSGFAMFTPPWAPYKNGTYMIFEKLRRFSRIAAAALLPLAAAAAHYPAKPLHLLVPFPPRGGNDGLARLISMQLGAGLGQQVLVDNRPGASGITATDIVAKSAPDGYTVLLGFIGPLALSPALTKVPYDPVADFASLGFLAESYHILVVNPAVPARSVKELVALAKREPGKLNYASSGQGANLHLITEIFKNATGIDMVHVPYKGAGPATTAVLAGEAQVLFGSISSSLSYARANRLVALAVTSPKRSPLAPELPTLLESGIADVDVPSWYTLLLPAPAQQQFPSRAIRFAVAFSPGGIADTIARSVGQKMSERIGQPVVVETRSGAGGMVGAKYVAAAAPDGYTLLVTTTALAINANTKEGVPLADLTPIAIAASTPTIFAVSGTATAKDLMDFVRNVKGGRFTFASAGIGSAEHLAGEYVFRAVPGLEATHVPFQGGAPVNTAILSKQVDVASTTLPTALAYVRGQTMRVLAVASQTRMAQLPQVPTLAEAGFPNYESASWIAFFAAAKLPDNIAQFLNAEINAALGQADV